MFRKFTAPWPLEAVCCILPSLCWPGSTACTSIPCNSFKNCTWNLVHVGGTRCVTSSTANIMKIHARITLNVEFIRTCIFLFLFYVEIQWRVWSRLTFFLILLIFRYNDRIAQAPHPTPLEEQGGQGEQEEQERLLVLARLEILIQDITWTMYVSVCRGLFEKDKMVFAATVAVSDRQCFHPFSTVILLCCEGGLLSTYCNVLSTFFQRSFNLLAVHLFLFQSFNFLSTCWRFIYSCFNQYVSRTF